MADMDPTQMATPDEALEPGAPAGDVVVETEEGAKKKGFFASTLGKVVLVGCAISLLLAVLGVVAFAVTTYVLVDDVVDELQTQGEQNVASGSTTGTAASAGETTGTSTDSGDVVGTGVEFEHADVGASDVHVWRDIFQPLITPVVEGADDGGGSGNTTGTPGGGSSSGYQADTLYLVDILSNGTETAAQFHYNGITYDTSASWEAGSGQIIVNEGDRIADTPWRLLSIGVTDVTVQYGDRTYTLGIGRGITK